jgi:multisubunit Na+/H+ antiporter MnhE subunit
MKLLNLAICSLGIWVLLSAFVSASWVGIVFGAITAVLALASAVKS